jgi:hypothetical protein
MTALAETAPAPRLIIDSPAAGETQHGAAIIRFHVEGLEINPDFGDEALRRKPPIGHLHVTVDGNEWIWVYTSANPIIIAGLKMGPHSIKLELADPNHQVLDKKTATFFMS